MTKEIIEEAEEENTEESKREIVVPGEIIVSGEQYLPGDGTRREGKDVVASRFGLAEVSGRLVKIIPLSGVYIPRYGNMVIGQVLDITHRGWIVNIRGPYQAFLPISETSRYINENELAEYAGIGDVLAFKVISVNQKGIDLTTKSRGLGRLDKGIMMNINSNKVPRVIGKEGSMIKLIKEKTNCDIIVGQNGIVWIKGNNINDELKAKEAILFITSKSFVSGLTEKVKEHMEEEK